MRTIARIAAFVGLALFMFGCSADRVVEPPADSVDSESATVMADAERVAGSIVEASGWELTEEFAAIDMFQPTEKSGALPYLLNYEREQITGDIYHYSWSIRIGADPFDVIGLHRVVRERAPNRPIKTLKSVFMLHGDYKTFAGCFLPGLSSPAYPDDFGAAAHVADGDIDVWGMDQFHNSIAADETDFSSLADLDMFKYVRDTRVGMTIARVVRLVTGNGYRKMNLLGYSGGAALGFAVVSEEVALPPFFRHVSGFIPVDQGPYSGDEAFAASDCGTGQYYADLVAAGEYVDSNFFPLFGEPARYDPDGPSDLIPGFTNLQAALALGVYPYVEGFPYHLLAGEFDVDGLPSGLQYTDVDLWIDFLVDAPPYFPNAFTRDAFLQACDEELAPWLADLDLIDLPVLYVSAVGGFGLLYSETLDRMTSADVSMLTIELHPPEELDIEFGHVDLFTAANAPALVWQPVLEWIIACRGAAEEEYPRLATDAN